MQHRRVTTLVALGATVAGLVPATLAAASGPSPAAADEYCAAHLALEAAIANEDEEDDAAAVEAAIAAAPEEVAEALNTVAENEPTDGPPSPEFLEAYGVVVDYVRENCGFAEIDVLAQDYSFGGIGGEVAAGPTIINLLNEGTEYHEMIVFRRNEGVTQPLEELLALPGDEAFAMLTFVGAVIARPGRIVVGGDRPDPRRVHRALLHPGGLDARGDGGDDGRRGLRRSWSRGDGGYRALGDDGDPREHAAGRVDAAGRLDGAR